MKGTMTLFQIVHKTTISQLIDTEIGSIGELRPTGLFARTISSEWN